MTKQIPRSQAQQGLAFPTSLLSRAPTTPSMQRGGAHSGRWKKLLSAQTGHLGHLSLVTWLSLELPQPPYQPPQPGGSLLGFGQPLTLSGLLLSSVAPTTITFTRAHRVERGLGGEPRNRAADRQHLSHLPLGERGHMTPIPQGGVEGLKEHR